MISDTRDGQNFGSVHHLRPDAELAGPAVVGEPVRIRTEDSSGGQIRPGVRFEDLDSERFFPVVGPIAIEGVASGDMVGIEILSLSPDPIAHTWTRPGLGLRGSEKLVVMQLSSRDLEIRVDGSLIAQVPANPHIGAIGLLPSTECTPRTLGSYGGNLDFPLMGAGAKVWLRAQVDGGGFFVGDVHAAMGEGEICGTGAETGGDIVVKFDVDRTWHAELPIVEAGGSIWAIGVGDNFEAALSVAVDYCVRRVAQGLGISEDEAYLTVGLLLRVTVCQLVNPRSSLAVTLTGGLDALLHGNASRMVRPRPS